MPVLIILYPAIKCKAQGKCLNVCKILPDTLRMIQPNTKSQKVDQEPCSVFYPNACGGIDDSPFFSLEGKLEESERRSGN